MAERAGSLSPAGDGYVDDRDDFADDNASSVHPADLTDGEVLAQYSYGPIISSSMSRGHADAQRASKALKTDYAQRHQRLTRETTVSGGKGGVGAGGAKWGCDGG